MSVANKSANKSAGKGAGRGGKNGANKTKSRRERALSGYETVWLIALFDLPMKTKAERKAYVVFKNTLESQGFSRLQYSVYGRFFGNEQQSQRYRRIIREALPEAGEVRLLTVTDHQFGKMEIYYQQKKGKPEKPPEQLMLF